MNAINWQTSAAKYAVLDIETGNAPAEFIEKALNDWKPPSNVKDHEKIESRRRDAMDKIMERGALLDASPILCVCIQTDRCSTVFNGMDLGPNEIIGWTVIDHSNEVSMLRSLRVWMDMNIDFDTDISGHNIRAFDLPKLRNAYVRNRLQLPQCLIPRENQNITDTAKLFKFFSMQHRDDFCPSLDDMADSLGLARHKQIVNGADVHKLHEIGEHKAILTYCCLDVATTTAAYLLMTGQSPELT